VAAAGWAGRVPDLLQPAHGLAADRTLAAVRGLGSERPFTGRPLPRPVDARDHCEQCKQDVEQVIRKFNHWMAPRPRASRKREMQSS
jgi:hypothetical protein